MDRSSTHIESLDIQFWTSIFSSEITSDECLSKVRSLLSCLSKITVARSFKGNEAQAFVDFLDRVSNLCASRLGDLEFQLQVLTQSLLDDKLRHRILLLLSKICKARGIIPSSYLLQRDFTHIGRVCYHGGFADVTDGEYLGRPVAIKYLKMDEENSDRIFKVPLVNLFILSLLSFLQRLCREIISWKHLSHPNVLPLLGVSMSTDPRCFSILTEWMPNGNVMRYARSNLEANRLQLVSLLAVSP